MLFCIEILSLLIGTFHQLIGVYNSLISAFVVQTDTLETIFRSSMRGTALGLVMTLSLLIGTLGYHLLEALNLSSKLL